ncbi:MAG: hypothetical protein WCY25_00690 [Moheibacter sp.]
MVSLLPKERQIWSSVNEKNKLVVDFAKASFDSQPSLASPDVEWAEFQADYEMRNFYESVINSLKSIVVDCESTKILHDHDNYHAAIADYRYSRYKVKSGGIGYEQKVEVYKEFFARKHRKAK